MKNLTVNLSNKCNIQCKHCCFSCSPTSTERLTEQEVWQVVQYGIDSSEISEIAITGGEPFLNEPLVLEIIEQISASGKVSTCITNGFWGRSYEKAREKLQKLDKLGLNALTISWDDFHKEYIPVENIRNILEASVQLKIRIIISSSVTRTKTGHDAFEPLSDALLGVSTTRFSVAPVGRAKTISDDEFYYKLDIDGPMPCSEPASGMVIHNDGYLYPCCSPLVFDTILRIGSVRKNTMSELDSKFHSNLLVYIIKKEGLNWFVTRAEAKGHTFSRKRYISSCQLCAEIFKNDAVANLLYEEIKAYGMQKLQKVRE